VTGSAAAADRDLLRRLIAGSDLERGEMEALVGRWVEGSLEPAFQAGLLTALAAKGESADEIAGAAAALRLRARRVPHALPDVVDTCGTGGDGRGTFNVSTAAAIVAAGAGVPIAKHGNRAVSSRSGSADVLAALGVEIELEPAAAGRCLEDVGIAFLFAPRLHPAMGAVAPVRRALGVRTLFNLLGPLANPAGAERQLLGVYSADLVEVMAAVLARLGSRHALVVHGHDGLDEITTTGPTWVAEVREGGVRTWELEPAAVGVGIAAAADLAGGDPAANAAALERLLAGEPGPLADITALNAGAAIYVGGRAAGLAEGVELARTALASGAARAKLSQLRGWSRRRAAEVEGSAG